MGTDPERISGSRYRAVCRLIPRHPRDEFRHIYCGFAAAWFDMESFYFGGEEKNALIALRAVALRPLHSWQDPAPAARR